jgi:hypothetical protein
MGSMLFTIMAALAQMEHEKAGTRHRFHQQGQKLERTWAAGPAGSLIVRFEALCAWSKAANPLHRLPAISECHARRRQENVSSGDSVCGVFCGGSLKLGNDHCSGHYEDCTGARESIRFP